MFFSDFCHAAFPINIAHNPLRLDSTEGVIFGKCFDAKRTVSNRSEGYITVASSRQALPCDSATAA